MPNFRCCPSHSHPKPQPPARRGHREPARAIRVRHPSQEQPPIKITGSSLNDACQLPVQFSFGMTEGRGARATRSLERARCDGTGNWEMVTRYAATFCLQIFPRAASLVASGSPSLPPSSSSSSIYVVVVLARSLISAATAAPLGRAAAVTSAGAPAPAVSLGGGGGGGVGGIVSSSVG